MRSPPLAPRDILLLVLVLLAFPLPVACSNAPSPAAPTAAPRSAPTPTVTPAPSATPVPRPAPAATPIPTAVPLPTGEPKPQAFELPPATQTLAAPPPAPTVAPTASPATAMPPQPSPTVAGGAPPANPRLHRTVRKVSDAVSLVRGMSFLQPVQPELVNREELADYLAARIDGEEQEELAKLQELYWALGLLDPSVELYPLYLDLLGEQVQVCSTWRPRISWWWPTPCRWTQPGH